MHKYSDLISQYKSIINFINENDHKNIVEFAIKAKKEFKSSAILISEWQKSRLKAKSKLPTYFNLNCILNQRSFEQCTHETIADYRFKNYTGKTALVIGGGLGVDEYYLSKRFEKIISIDPDEDLNEIVRFNYELLGIKNIERLAITAENFLKNNTATFDYIFIDPDRRTESNRKFALNELKPDILEIMPFLLLASNNIEVKLSPLIDYNFLLNCFNFTVDISSYSLQNEVKEVLLSISEKSNRVLKAYDIQNNGIDFKYEELPIKGVVINKETKTNKYLFVPYKVLYKLDLQDQYAKSNNLEKIEEKCLFYTSDQLNKNSIGGNWYKIELRPKSLSDVNKFIKQNNLKYLNVSCLKSEIKETEVFKYTGLQEGGNHFLFVYGPRKNPIMIIGKRVN